MKEVLFSGRLPITPTSVERSTSLKCEVIKTHEHLEIRLTDTKDMFNLYYSYITPSEYHNIRREQDLRVDYERFTYKLLEMLNDAVKGNLLLLFGKDGSKLVFLERNDFRNIVRLEVKLSRPDDVHFRRYISDIIGKTETENTRLARENAILKSEVETKDSSYSSTVSRLESELSSITTEYSGVKRNVDRYVQEIQELKREIQKNDMASSSLQMEKDRRIVQIEEDLGKANELVKRFMDESVERKRMAGVLQANEKELERIREEWKEKTERVRELEEIRDEKNEVIKTLKTTNEALTSKLDNMHAIYSKIYKQSKTSKEDSSEAMEDSNSLVLPEKYP